MIESISIADIATFEDTPETLNGLSQFNYIFGSNGTGKTTISRIITDAGNHPNCRVTWRGGTKLQAMVYNHDPAVCCWIGFVEVNVPNISVQSVHKFIHAGN